MCIRDSPDIMEAEAVHRLLVIADAANAPVMVVHLTNRKAFEEVMRARMNGQKVYAETCPQYLLLDDSVYSKPDFEGAKYVLSLIHISSVKFSLFLTPLSLFYKLGTKSILSLTYRNSHV